MRASSAAARARSAALVALARVGAAVARRFVFLARGLGASVSLAFSALSPRSLPFARRSSGFAAVFALVEAAVPAPAQIFKFVSRF